MHFKLVPRWKGESIVWSGRHACHVRVRGKVQGVFFRAWTREQARELHLCGWVRNCADGSVEAHIEGGRVELEEMMKRMRQGPPAARVDDLQAQNAAPEDTLEFEVRH